MWFGIWDYLHYRKIGDIVVCENYCGFRVFSKISLNKEKLKMRKILCFGSGIALFCVAGLLYVAGNQNNQPGMRSVGKDEARLVMGGGQYGKTNKTKDGYTCRNGYTGCTGTGYSLSGADQLQGWKHTNGKKFCGGASACTAYQYSHEEPVAASE
ncbi:MAG: hypothetical protein LBJ00_14955 [Planctomycetaceae bacterium]|jgi:hypothetical protein|nr:hypothetical protein [Planctomycetaceae bacterium]